MRRIKQIDNRILFFYYFCLSIIFIIISFLCLNFYVIVDDLVFAGVIKHNSWSFKEIITVNGVNGRYLGNLFGVVFSWLGITGFWWIKSLFNIICMSVLFVAIAKAICCEKKHFAKTLILVCVFMLVPNIYHFHQFYGFSACFMNYLLPLMILLIIFDLIKAYVNTGTNYIPLICILSFIDCLFIEHITVYLFLVCLSFLIYSFVKKQYFKLSIPMLISSICGMGFMFSYPLICANETEYRSSVLSEGLGLLFSNIADGIKFYIFDNTILTIIIAIIGLLCLIKFRKKKVSYYILSFLCSLIFFASCVCALILYFGNWESTFLRVFVSKPYVVFLTISYFLALGIILFFVIPKDVKEYKNILFYYFSIWLIFGMLSAVSPIGPRNFMITYTFLVIIILKVWNALSLISRKILKTALTVMLSFVFVFDMMFVCKAYYIGNKIQNERFEYVEEQMVCNKKQITLPDSVNFTDSGGLTFILDLYYYESPGDIEFSFIPYIEWKNQ